MKVRRFALTSFVLVMVFVLTAPAAVMAQADVERIFVITTNPILDMFTWYNGEAQLKISTAASIGVSGTYFNFKQEETVFTGTSASTTLEIDDTYLSLYGFYRYFMMGEALKGFYFSGRIGFNNITVHNLATHSTTGLSYWEEETGTYYGVGIDIGYCWLLGDTERFSVDLGIGAIRLFGGDLEDADVTMTLPTIRLVNIGVAF